MVVESKDVTGVFIRLLISNVWIFKYNPIYNLWSELTTELISSQSPNTIFFSSRHALLISLNVLLNYLHIYIASSVTNLFMIKFGGNYCWKGKVNDMILG